MLKKKQVKTLSVYDFFVRYPNEEMARKELEAMIWGDTPICHRCNGSNYNVMVKIRGYYCKSCRRNFTIKSNTVFSHSNLKYSQWLYIMYLMQTSRKDISSLQLRKEIGCTQKSAWHVLQRVREACRPGVNKLDGVIEMDEAYIGGKNINRHVDKKIPHSQGLSKEKAIVFGIKQRNGEVKAKVMNSVTKENVMAYVGKNIKTGATVFTDKATHFSHTPYVDLDLQYDWDKVDHGKKEYVRDEVHANSIESVWAILKRAHKGTSHNISKKHLQKYVDEIDFRLNAGNVEVDTINRIEAVIRNSVSKSMSYKELVR